MIQMFGEQELCKGKKVVIRQEYSAEKLNLYRAGK